MRLREKVRDFFFEKDDDDVLQACALIRSHDLASRSVPVSDPDPLMPASWITKAAMRVNDTSTAVFPPVPFAPRKNIPQPDHENIHPADAEMHWLDDSRISTIFHKLGLDETFGEEVTMVPNVRSRHVAREEGNWASLTRASDAVTFPIFALDNTRCVIVWNKAMEVLTGVSATAMLGKGNYEYSMPFYGTRRPMLVDYLLVPPVIRKISELITMTREGETYNGAVEDVRIKGKPMKVRCRATRIYGPDGMVIAGIQSIGINLPSEGLEGVCLERKNSESSLANQIPDISGTGLEKKISGPHMDATGTAPPSSPEPYSDTDIIRRELADVHNAFSKLKATEETLLRNCEELIRTREQLDEIEQKIQEGGFFLESVIADAREGIVAFDNNLCYTLWNRFMEDLTGIPAKKVLGRAAGELFPMLKVSGADLLLERALSGEIVESSDISFFVPYTSKQIWVRVIYSPLYGPGRTILGVIGVIQDTTARKVMEYALQTTIVQLMESESKYRNVFNARNVPHIIINGNTHAIIDLNDAAAELYGWSREEMLELFLSDISEESEITGMMEGGRVSRLRILNQRKKDGSIFPADISADYFTLRGVSVMILSIRDLSSFHQIAESLRIANAKLNLIIGITRHDVLNTLTAVSGYNELLQCENTDARFAEMLKTQQKAIVTIRNHIEFTRDYDDLGVREPLWQNICTVASRAYAHFMQTISFSCTTADLEVYADPLLERVLYNLFDNSFRYGEGITEIRISHKSTPGGIVIVFEDDGTGVAPEEKERIFLRGVGKNTGMGLFLTREILMITRIDIIETGEYRKGARFEFRIPNGSFRFAGTASPPIKSVQKETTLPGFLKQVVNKPNWPSESE